MNALPAYMVPAAVVVMDALPLTVNGKAGPACATGPGYRGWVKISGTSTPTELAIGEICAQVLGLARVGADDSFFEMGGDSIRRCG